jgi:two-component system, response regulator YesN
MVVEDEPPILRNISSTIEEVNPEFKVVASCDNGTEAIHSLEAEVPDVLFTDIQMSEVDGLELIKYIRENRLDIEVVILSGYSEFKYARTALVLGVEDYLLKPLNKPDLALLLSKLKVKIVKKRESLHREYLGSLLHNRYSSREVGKVDMAGDAYFLMLFCAGSFPIYSLDYYSPSREFWNKIDLNACISQFLCQNENIWVFEGSTSAEKVAVFVFKDQSQKRVAYILDSVLEALRNSAFPVNIIQSRFTDKAAEIGDLLKQLRIQLSRNMIFGKSKVFHNDDRYALSNIPDDKLPMVDVTLEKRLMMCIENQKKSVLKSELQNLLKLWEASDFLQIWVEKLLNDLVFQTSKKLKSTNFFNSTALELQINEAISVSNGYEELFNNIWYIFEELFDERMNWSLPSESKEALMMKIDLYIRRNLTEAISNHLLSDKFGLAPSYLSKLFREYKGMSPTDYLFFLRIEKAKELMQTQPELFTKDIATITGFCDPFHFSKVFKRETGLSPSEYKNSIKK